MKRFFCFVAMTMMGLPMIAQSEIVQSDSLVMSSLKADPLNEKSTKNYIPVFQYWQEHDIFQHLDLSVTAGSTGIGIDLATPIGQYVQLRAGYEVMPRFTKTMEFDLTIKGQPVRRYDENGNRVETTFDKLKDFLYDFTGYDVEDHADMVGKPTMSNAKVLVDVFPFKNNKHWHFTAGFYWGPSTFAEAENSTETMITLVSTGMYNKMYDKAIAGQPLIDFSKFTDMKNLTIELDDNVIKKFESFGRLGFSVGYYSHDVDGHQKGDRYILEPDDDSMVRVKAQSWAFKPYLGFGYGGRLLKKRDDWKVSFDLGAMFWGGTPDLYTHDGTNLTKDVENINGKVGDYVELFRAFKVYPVLSFRLTKRIF